MLFFRRLLPNVDAEIAEAENAARARDYGELIGLMLLLRRKNSFMLKTCVELYLVLSGAIAPSAPPISEQQLLEGTRQVEVQHPRPIDKVSVKDLHYYNAD